MNIFDRIACRFCAWRVRLNLQLAEAYRDQAQYWSERELHYATRHMIAGKPTTADTSDPPFLPPPEQRAREAGA